MTQENTTESQDREAQEAAFNAAVDGTAPPQAEQPQPEAQAVVEKEVEKAIEEAIIAGYKESDVKARLGKVDELESSVRKAHGQVGGLRNYIDEKIKSLSTASPSGFRVNQEALDNLISQYPDLGFDKLFEKAEPQKQVEPQVQQTQQVQQPAQIDVSTVKYQAAVEALDEAHPDRLEIIKSPEYSDWLKAMKEDERVKFLNSVAPVYVSRKLDEFKDWKAKRQDKAKANEKRLAGAIQPRGTPSAAPSVVSDEVAMRQAFDAVFTT